MSSSIGGRSINIITCIYIISAALAEAASIEKMIEFRWDMRVYGVESSLGKQFEGDEKRN
jgi:hypothetical protein